MPTRHKNTRASARHLLDFILLYAKLYLASGGPTSRLEESLVLLSSTFGYDAEIFATPTGVFVSLKDPEQKTALPNTSLVRVREMGTNLGRLAALENVSAELAEGKIELERASQWVHRLHRREFYPLPYTAIAAFVSGWMISFSGYQIWGAAILSGLLTCTVWFLGSRVFKAKINNPVFSDFLGALIALIVADLANYYFPVSIEAYAKGTLVLLVPGLALTNAISELAEQNLVSGTAKLMQAFLTLIALGLAYLLSHQLARTMGMDRALITAVYSIHSIWLSGLAVLVSIICYGVIFKVPPRSLGWASVTGFVGWLVLTVPQWPAAEAATYLASFTVALLSMLLGSALKKPSQIFSVPGIIAMLPGMLALSSFNSLTSGFSEKGFTLALDSATTAVSIVFGLITGRLVARLIAANPLRLKSH